MEIADVIQLIIPIAGIAAVLFALWLARGVIAADQGTPAMQDVAGTIYEGAVAFIRRQYTTIGILAIGGAIVIGLVIALVEGKEVADTDVFGTELGIKTGLAFLVGAVCSMASGIIGMFISVKANLRTAAAARSQPGRVRSRSPCAAGPSPASWWWRSRCSACGASSRRSAGSRIRPGRARRAVPDRRLRLRRLVRGALRPARRRYLHQGRRRRLGPRRQGRGGHPRGRPAQRGRHRGPRGRQRRRLRRPWRRPVRVHRRREHRRDDPRGRPSHHRQANGWPNPEAWIFFPLVVRAFGLLASIVACSSSAAARTRTRWTS